MKNILNEKSDCEEQYHAIKIIQEKLNKEALNNQQVRSSCFGFIYEKDNEKRVFNFDDSKKYHIGLINNGWKHIETVDLCMYVEYLIKKI